MNRAIKPLTKSIRSGRLHARATASAYTPAPCWCPMRGVSASANRLASARVTWRTDSTPSAPPAVESAMLPPLNLDPPLFGGELSVAEI